MRRFSALKDEPERQARQKVDTDSLLLVGVVHSDPGTSNAEDEPESFLLAGIQVHLGLKPLRSELSVQRQSIPINA